MKYRVYYGGGDQREAWIIQEMVEGKPRTVAVVAEVTIRCACRLPVPVEGPKPNGVLEVEGALRVANFEIPLYAVKLGWKRAWIE